MLKETVIQKILLKCIFIIFLFPLHAFSQDISGVWTGYIYNDTTHRNIHYELAVNEPDGKSGFTHTTFIFDSVKNIGVKSVKIKMKNEHIFVEDDQFIYNNYSIPPPKGVKMYSALVFSQNDSADVLTGMWRTNGTKIYSPVTGTVFLERKRKEKPQETIIVAKLIDLGLRDKLTFLKPEIALNNSLAINDQPPAKRNPSLSTPVSTSEKTKTSNQQESQQETITEGNKNLAKQGVPKKEEPVIIQKEQPAKEMVVKNESPEKPVQQNKLPPTLNPSKKEEPTIAINEKKHSNPVVAEKEISKEPVQQLKQEPQQKETSQILKPRKEEPAIAVIEKKPITATAPKKENVEKPAQVKQQPQQNNIAPITQPEKEEPVVVSSEKKAQSLPKKQEDIKKPAEQAKVVAQQQPITTVTEKKEEPAFATNEKPAAQTQTQPAVSIIKAPAAAAEISKRTIETIRTVEINQDSLVLSLYDNGTVDGDTVSVLLNGEVIMPRVGLRATAINKTIYLTPEMGDSISVIMYAENLGSIPPNTGLLVIREAKRIYEIRFSGDLNKNSKIILIRKKQE